MGWEAGIMQKTAQLLCEQRDPDSDEFVVMNVGFGLGLVSFSGRQLPSRSNDAEAPGYLQRSIRSCRSTSPPSTS